MKTPKIIPLLTVLLSLTASTLAGSTDNAAIAAVLAADQARNTALVAHDLQALDRILAPNFNYTHSNNFQETKASHIESLKNGLHYTKFETSELRANVITPDVVTLNGFFDQIKSKEGNIKKGKFLFLAVWHRTGDTWRLTSLQSTLPPVTK